MAPPDRKFTISHFLLPNIVAGAIHTEFGAITSNMTDFLFWGFKKKAKKIEKMVKNDFFQKSKKMPLSTP